MDEMINKLELIKSIFGKIEDYYGKLKPLLENLYQDIKIRMDELIKHYYKNIKHLQLASNDIPNIFYSIHSLNTLANDIHQMFSQISTVNIKSTEYSTYLSQTYIMETTVIHTNIVKEYQIFSNKINTIDNNMIMKMADQLIPSIINSANIENELKIIQNIFRKYPLSIYLYTKIMQGVLNRINDKNIENIIMSMIEDDKDFVLLNNHNFESNDKLSQINPFLISCGLFPICPADTLKNIIQKIFGMSFGDIKIIKKDLLKKIGQKNNICIIIIKKIVKNPLEFRPWRLIDSNIIQQYIEKNNSVTKKLIDRYKTIQYTSDVLLKWDFSFESHGVDIKTAEKFAIIETGNNVTYRILMPWVTETKFIIPKHKILCFISFVQHKGHLTRNRIDQYHNIMIKKSLNTIFLKNTPNIKKLEKVSKIHESKFLRNILLNELINVYYGIVNNKYNNGKKIKHKLDFSEIIHNNDIYNKFAEIIIFHYNKYMEVEQNLFKDNKFPISEILITFLSYLKHLTIEFNKEMHSQYQKNEPDNAIFQTSTAEIVMSLQRLFEKILYDALNIIITDDSNIYQSALLKYNLLTVT